MDFNDSKKGIGRIFTSNPAFAGHQPRLFTSIADVEKVFGADSEEYAVAENFFEFVSSSKTPGLGIQFASWGYGGTNPWKMFSATGSGKEGFVFTNLVDGSETTYSSIQEALDAIGDRAMIRITLTDDVLYVTEATKADSERFSALEKTCGAGAFTVTDESDKLNGFTIGEKQIVVIDLAGHKICGDVRCFWNKGFLTINDSVGTGCAFTTNYEALIDGHIHSSRFEAAEDRVTTETIRNEGSLIVNGGWFGTDRPTMAPAVNEVNWGNSLGAHGESVTIVNGGHFTCGSWHNNTKVLEGLADQLGQDSWFAKRSFPKPDFSYSPYSAVIDVYDASHIQWNSGDAYGLYNDIFEVEGIGTTPESFGIVEVNGGEFYCGFPGYTFVPTVNFGMQSMLQASAPSNQYLPSELPKESDLAFEGYSYIVVNGGRFEDNVSCFTESGARCRLTPPRGRTDFPDSALRMTGLVAVKGGTFNFTFSKEFRDLNPSYSIRPMQRMELTESKADAISDSLTDSGSNGSFGVFAFVEDVSDADARAIAKSIATDRFCHIFACKGSDLRADGIAHVEDLKTPFAELCRAFSKAGSTLIKTI